MLKKIIKDFIFDKTKVLFSILILTLVVLPTTYSRYINQEHGAATTRLAKWEVNLIGNDNEELEFVLENNVTSVNYMFSVTSTSNVACDYSIILSNIPNGITVKIDNSQIYTPTNGELLIENLDGFEVNSLNTTHEHILTFISNSGIAVSNGIELDLQVDIKQRLLSEVGE